MFQLVVFQILHSRHDVFKPWFSKTWFFNSTTLICDLCHMGLSFQDLIFPRLDFSKTWFFETWFFQDLIFSRLDFPRLDFSKTWFIHDSALLMLSQLGQAHPVFMISWGLEFFWLSQGLISWGLIFQDFIVQALVFDGVSFDVISGFHTLWI